MKKIFIPNIGDLSDIQHSSYYKFLLKGLENELKSLEKIYLNVDFLQENILYKIYFLAKNAKFTFPEENFLESILEEETYSLHTYLPIFYSCKEINNILNYLPNKKFENINIIKNRKWDFSDNIIIMHESDILCSQLYSKININENNIHVENID